MLGYLLDPAIQVQNENGVTIAGARIYVYNSNTSVLAETYKDFNGTRNTNPVITDTLGNCTVIVEDGIAYDVILKDAQDNLLFSKQNVTVTHGGSVGNVQVAAGYGIEVTPSVSASVQKYEVAIDPTIVETIDTITKYEAGDNIVLTDLPNNKKAINLADEVVLSENNYQSTLNSRQNTFTNTSASSIQNADGFYVSDENQTEFTDITKNYIQIVGPSTASIDKRLVEQDNLLQIDYTDNGNSTYKTLSATPDDVTIWRHRGSGPAEYSLTGACASAQSAWSAIINRNVSAAYATNAMYANYATFAASAYDATRAISADHVSSANYATLAHTAETLPYGRASWDKLDTGDKIVAFIEKPDYDGSDVIVTFDIYETFATMSKDAYRGKLCIDIHRDTHLNYQFHVSYTGKKLNYTTLYVKRFVNNNVYVIINKSNTNMYCGVKAVVKSATGWRGDDFLSYVILNDDPDITDTSSYTNITINESQPVTAPMSGIGDVWNPVYIDNVGIARECIWDSIKFAKTIPNYFSADAGSNIMMHVPAGSERTGDSIDNSIFLTTVDNFLTPTTVDKFHECVFVGKNYMYSPNSAGTCDYYDNTLIGSNSITNAQDGSHYNTIIGSQNDLLGADHSNSTSHKFNSTTFIGYQNNSYTNTVNTTVVGSNNDIGNESLSEGTNTKDVSVSVFGYANDYKYNSTNGSPYYALIVGEHNKIVNSNGYKNLAIGFDNSMSGNNTFLIGDGLSATNEGSFADKVMKIGFGNCHLEIHSTGTIYKVVNGTKTQI